MKTEIWDIVNELSYGCVSVQTPPFQSALKHTADCWQVCSFCTGGLAQASSTVSTVEGRAHTSSHQRTTQTRVIDWSFSLWSVEARQYNLSLASDVGMGSRLQVFFALLLMSSRTFSSVRGVNLMRGGGDTWVWSSGRDGSPCTMLSSLEPMVTIFWIKKVPNWFANLMSSSTGGYIALLSLWLRNFFAAENRRRWLLLIILDEVMIEFASSFIHQSIRIVLFCFVRQHIFPRASSSPLPLSLPLLPPRCLDFLVEPGDQWPRAYHFCSQWRVPVKGLS